MVTKGTIEDIINNSKIVVRCPIYDKIETSSENNNPKKEFTLCCSNGVSLNPVVGDVVFVGFEENDMSNGVILGFLSKRDKQSSSVDLTPFKIDVKTSAKLPQQTSIGGISSNDIKSISGVSGNISEQIKNVTDGNYSLEKEIDDFMEEVSDTTKKTEFLAKKMDSQIEILQSIIKLIGNKNDIGENTLFGRLNSYNKVIDDLLIAIGEPVDNTTLADKIKELNKMCDALTANIIETPPSLDTDSNYMLGRAEKMVNVSWEAKSTFSKWNSSESFIKGNTYYGMPYTLFWYGYTFEKWRRYSDANTSLTGTFSGYGERTGPKYGSCCADFVSEVFGLPEHKRSCSALCSYPQYLDKYTGENAKAYKIQAGDALVDSGITHVIWVGKVNGNELTVYQQTPPLAKKSIVNISKNMVDGYLYLGGKKYSILLRPNNALLELDINKKPT